MAMENLLKMESKVECSQDSMKLLVHDATSTPESLILVDRGMFFMDFNLLLFMGGKNLNEKGKLFYFFWSSIFFFSGNLSPLSLTKLPSSCGYTIRSTQKDLVLQAPYDGCFVIIQVGFLFQAVLPSMQSLSTHCFLWLQENYYVLPLIWLGLPVRMSCPLMGKGSQNPPMVTCHAEGMVVKTEWTTAASKIKVNGMNCLFSMHLSIAICPYVGCCYL